MLNKFYHAVTDRVGSTRASRSEYAYPGGSSMSLGDDCSDTSILRVVALVKPVENYEVGERFDPHDRILKVRENLQSGDRFFNFLNPSDKYKGSIFSHRHDPQ